MIAIIGIVVGCFVASSIGASNDPVFTLTDQNFDQFLRDKAVMLVDFYAPWCSDCKNLKPHFNKAAQDLGKQHKYVFAKVDCFGAGRFTCSNKFAIHQWPTLKIFKYGQYAGDYTGPYDEGQIENYVNDALNDQPYPANDERGPNGLPRSAHQQYNNLCKQYGWTYSSISPNACG